MTTNPLPPAPTLYGPEDTTEAVLDHLTAALPAALDVLRVQRGLTDADLPNINPASCYPFDKALYGVEAWPVLALVLVDTDPISVSAAGPDGVWLAPQYNARAYVWARGEWEREAHAQRMRYLTALRSVLFTQPYVSDVCQILTRGVYKESYTELMDDDTGGTIGAAVATFQIRTSEQVRAPGSIVAAPPLLLDLDTAPLPPAPPPASDG